jgi:hypothetical protein
VDDAPALLWYDGSKRAPNAITAGAVLLISGTAVILNVGPLAPVAEAYAARPPVLVVPPANRR